MGELEPMEDPIEFGRAIFIPSHATKALLGVGVSVGAGLLSVGAFAYAVNELRKTNWEEISALVRPPQDG